MTPDPATATAARRRRTRWIAGVAVGSVLLAVLLAGPPGEPGRALDPHSPQPSGLLGIVRLLQASDVQVDISLEPPSDLSTRLFVPVDRLPEQRRSAILDWVDRGGTVVVAGESSLHQLQPTARPLSDLLGPAAREPGCDPPTLAGVGEVRAADWRGWHAAPADTPDGDGVTAVRCFPLGDDAWWLVAVPRGAGTVVALGSAAPLTNGLLDRADNAVLAAALLGPSPGDRLRIVPLPPVGSGDTPLLDLLADALPGGLLPLAVLLAAAVVLLVVARSRRLGPPVDEVLPPVLPTAELARSVAALLQRAGSRQEAADRLRRAARREVIGALGLSPDLPQPALAGFTAGRCGLAPDRTALVLVDAAVASDDRLVEVALAQAELRRHLRARNGPGPGSPDGPGPASGPGSPDAPAPSGVAPPPAGEHRPEADTDTTSHR
jgi:hypothetical protein